MRAKKQESHVNWESLTQATFALKTIMESFVSVVEMKQADREAKPYASRMMLSQFTSLNNQIALKHDTKQDDHYLQSQDLEPIALQDSQIPFKVSATVKQNYCLVASVSPKRLSVRPQRRPSNLSISFKSLISDREMNSSLQTAKQDLLSAVSAKKRMLNQKNRESVLTGSRNNTGVTPQPDEPITQPVEIEYRKVLMDDDHDQALGRIELERREEERLKEERFTQLCRTKMNEFGQVRVNVNDPNAPAFTTDYEGKAVLLDGIHNFPKTRNAVKMQILTTSTRVSTFKRKVQDQQDLDATPVAVVDQQRQDSGYLNERVLLNVINGKFRRDAGGYEGMIETKKSIVNLPLKQGVRMGQTQQLGLNSARPVLSVDQPKMSELPSRLKSYQTKLGEAFYRSSHRNLQSVSSQKSMLVRISKLSRFQNEGSVQCSDTKSVAQLLLLREDDLVVQNIEGYRKKHSKFFNALRQSSLMLSAKSLQASQESLYESTISILPRINNPNNKQDITRTSHLPKLILSPKGNLQSMMTTRGPLTSRV